MWYAQACTAGVVGCVGARRPITCWHARGRCGMLACQAVCGVVKRWTCMYTPGSRSTRHGYSPRGTDGRTGSAGILFKPAANIKWSNMWPENESHVGCTCPRTSQVPKQSVAMIETLPQPSMLGRGPVTTKTGPVGESDAACWWLPLLVPLTPLVPLLPLPGVASWPAAADIAHCQAPAAPTAAVAARHPTTTRRPAALNHSGAKRG